MTAAAGQPPIEISDEMVGTFIAAEQWGLAVVDNVRAGLVAVAPLIAAQLAAAGSEQVWTGGQHRYLSTGCLHGRHDYCIAMTGYQGQKRAATCKFCDAHCVCECHTEGGEQR